LQRSINGGRIHIDFKSKLGQTKPVFDNQDEKSKHFVTFSIRRFLLKLKTLLGAKKLKYDVATWLYCSFLNWLIGECNFFSYSLSFVWIIQFCERNQMEPIVCGKNAEMVCFNLSMSQQVLSLFLELERPKVIRKFG